MSVPDPSTTDWVPIYGSTSLPDRLATEAQLVTDWNLAVENGWYYNEDYGSAINGPGGDYYIGQVFRPGDLADGGSGDFIVQILYDLGYQGRMFIRAKMYGGWNPWYAIEHTFLQRYTQAGSVNYNS